MNIFEQLQQLSPVKRELYRLLLDQEGIDISLLPITRREESNAPLSYVQQSLLFLKQLVPESTAYNREHALCIKGDLDISSLKQSLQYLLQRHDILRTGYVIEDTVARQYVRQDIDINLDVIDLSHLDANAALTEAIRMATEESVRPFDLSSGDILRTALYQLDQNDFIFLMVIHHIAVDGFSEAILTKELATIYQAIHDGDTIELPELPISYGDYSVWERSLVENGFLNHQIDYWTEHLKNTPDHLDINCDRPRPGMVSFKGYTRNFEIEPDLYNRLKHLSSQMGTTLFMTILAAYQILLYRYSRQNKFVVATGVSIRNRPELENLIGCMANVIVIKADFSEDLTFESYIKLVSSDALDAYSNQDLPFETLVEHLHPKRDMSYNPIFQTSFDLLQESFTQNLKLKNLDISELRLHKHASKYDLGLVMLAGEDTLAGSVEYNSDLFDLERIDDMLHAFNELIRSIVANPQASISELTALTASEKALIIDQWSRGPVEQVDNSAGIHQLFEQQVHINGDKTAVICNDRKLSYQELDDRSNQLARYLISKGVSGKTKLAICLEPSKEMLVAILGVLKAGACYIPLDPLYPQDRIKYMLEDAAAGYVISQTSVTESISFPENCIPVLIDADSDNIEAQPKQAPVIPHHPDDLAYIIYTSGSTGKPKGVMVHHHAVVNFLGSMAKKPGFNPDDKLLAVTTLSFDIAVLELFLPLITGGSVVIASREQATDGDEIARMIEQENISVMQATPATWRLLLTSGWQGSTNLKALCGGEALQQDLVKNLLPKTRELWNMYGPTETTVWSTCYRITDTDKPPLIGRPIDNTQCYALSEYLQPVPVGVPGELYIGGSGVSKGYLNRNELTTERFIDNPFSRLGYSKLYRTGDLVKYQRDGNLEYIQRIDNQVKVRGFRIELGEIESVIAKQDGILHTCVTVREERAGDPRIIAYIVLAPGVTLTPTEMRKNIRQMLPDYMIPQYFIEMDQLPLTPNGKIDRKALPSPFTAHHQEIERVAPRNHSEKLLAEIWADTLDIQYDQISIHDNFYEIGGHSLLSMQVVSRLRDISSANINISDIVLNSLAQIAAKCEFIDANSNADTDHDLIIDDHNTRKPVLRSLLKKIFST